MGEGAEGRAAEAPEAQHASQQPLESAFLAATGSWTTTALRTLATLNVIYAQEVPYLCRPTTWRPSGLGQLVQPELRVLKLQLRMSQCLVAVLHSSTTELWDCRPSPAQQEHHQRQGQSAALTL
mmetsp:Transcript_46135/g.121890  ORF Transcript_46135/g.121890 Transcript_46135/m.121890 type:complete len:124 (-) Transcript_46135:1329-1700(-)